jgi:hypothetical protein
MRLAQLLRFWVALLLELMGISTTNFEPFDAVDRNSPFKAVKDPLPSL